MSEPATNNGDDEIVTVDFKVTRSFLDEIEDTWQGRGFNSRSECIRYTLVTPSNIPRSTATNSLHFCKQRGASVNNGR